MRTFWLGSSTLCVLALSSACSQATGTCLDESRSENVQFCKLGIKQKHCRGTFFEEDSTAGLLRCRGEGYDSSTPASQLKTALEKGDIVVFSRRGK